MTRVGPWRNRWRSARTGMAASKVVYRPGSESGGSVGWVVHSAPLADFQGRARTSDAMNGFDQSHTNPFVLDLDARVPCECRCGAAGKGRWYRRRCSRQGVWRLRLNGPPWDRQAEAILRPAFGLTQLTETVVTSETVCDECVGHWVDRPAATWLTVRSAPKELDPCASDGIWADLVFPAPRAGSVTHMSEMEPEMPAAVTHRALMGRLAWRAGFNEEVATDALRMLMESPRLRERLLAHLAGRFAEQHWPVDVASVTRCDGQVSDKVHGRPDLVFRDAQGKPALVVEAKLLDWLRPEQATQYLRWQGDQAPERSRALVLLVADHRIEVVRDAGIQAADEVGESHQCVLVVGWGEVLGVLDVAAAELGTSPRSYCADVVQLTDLVYALTGSRLPPLVGTPGIENWNANLDALNELVKVVGERVNERRGTSPTRPQLEPVNADGFGPYHYVCDADGIHYALGLHRTFASRGLSPLWMRVNKETAGGRRPVVEALRSRLASDGRWPLLDDQGHVWVSISIGESWDDDLADRVVADVLQILDVAMPDTAEVADDDGKPS